MSSPATIVCYATGHGWGHARRTAQVVRALANVRPELRVVIRTQAPAHIFAGIPNVVEVSKPGDLFDCGVIEHDLLTIDAPASVARLTRIIASKKDLVAQEAAFLKSIGAKLVVADVSFLAGDAAASAGIHCVAIANFTWDWIFEPFVDGSTAHLLNEIRPSYMKMAGAYRTPLSHEMPFFKQVIDVPLVAARSSFDARTTLAELKIDRAAAYEKIILIVLRKSGPDDAKTIYTTAFWTQMLRTAAAKCSDALFLVTQPIGNAPPNLRSINIQPPLDFSDVVRASDAVVSKLGYGVLSECILNRVPLLYPPRVGFREDNVTQEQAPRMLRMQQIHEDDFQAGNWNAPLSSLTSSSPAIPPTNCDGDIAIAQGIIRLLETGKM